MDRGGNIQCTWSNSRENMNPKNNRRVLFNFFKPRLLIKAEQTYPFFFASLCCPVSFAGGKKKACFEKEELGVGSRTGLRRRMKTLPSPKYDKSTLAK